jgi:hypothetical protein
VCILVVSGKYLQLPARVMLRLVMLIANGIAYHANENLTYEETSWLNLSTTGEIIDVLQDKLCG